MKVTIIHGPWSSVTFKKGSCDLEQCVMYLLVTYLTGRM